MSCRTRKTSRREYVMTTVNGAGNLGTNVKVTLYVRDDIPGTNDQAHTWNKTLAILGNFFLFFVLLGKLFRQFRFFRWWVLPLCKKKETLRAGFTTCACVSCDAVSGTSLPVDNNNSFFLHKMCRSRLQLTLAILKPDLMMHPVRTKVGSPPRGFDVVILFGCTRGVPEKK